MVSSDKRSVDDLRRKAFGGELDVPNQVDEPAGEYDDTEAYCASRISGRMEPGIDLVRPDGDVEGFEYSTLLRRRFIGGKIELTFAADEMIRVTIEGRGLRKLFSLIRRHVCCEVREVARDMGQDGDVVVESITVKVVEAEKD